MKNDGVPINLLTGVVQLQGRYIFNKYKENYIIPLYIVISESTIRTIDLVWDPRGRFFWKNYPVALVNF